MVVVRLDRLAALNHVPNPPTEREVLETSPAHEAAQPPGRPRESFPARALDFNAVE